MEPCIHSKEPFKHSKEPYIHSKEPYKHSKEPYILSKEPYNCNTARYIQHLERSPTVLDYLVSYSQVLSTVTSHSKPVAG